MTDTGTVFAVLSFLAAGALLSFGIASLREKGPLLNNAWLYASRKERETMDKSPWYRQTGIVFCMLSALFAVIGLALVLHSPSLLLLQIPLVAAVLVYAVVSTNRIRRQKKE